MAEFKTINERLQGEISERKQVEGTLQETLEKLKGTVREVEQRNRHITLLNELTDLLQSCLTPKEAHDSIAHFIPQLFPCSSGTLFVLNPRRGLLLEAAAGWGEVQSDEQVFTADSCWALRRGGVHLVKRESSALICQHVPAPLSADYMCVPMVAQGEILGLLYLQAPSDQSQGPSEAAAVHLNETDQHLAITVAKQISLALANLSLRESLQIQAIVDPLTGLFNRRYMEETFERELHRAIRRKAPIGVIMVDLDHFKRINDNFGHDAGDLVLVTLAGLFKRSVRREDVPCRYGGEEFLLIMPEASLEIACGRAEKLREQIGQLEVKHLGLALGTITASFGVACYPDHGEQVEEIIRMADAALYSAKQEGRNRVVAGKQA
jgi:diguanylate cyclase (GGDEF)-like protein